MLKKIKSFAKQATNKVVDITKKVIYGRNDFSPSCKTIMKKYGELPVVGITVFRHPLNELLVSAIDMISNQNFRKNIKLYITCRSKKTRPKS